MFRDKSTVDTHKKYRTDTSSRGIGCTLCKDLSNEVFEESENFFVVENIFPYSNWDAQGVVDHRMIIPKEHIKFLDDLSGEQRLEMMSHLASYEQRGYNMYKRCEQNANGSIPDHIHWHLIKLDQKKITRMSFSVDPYHLEIEQ